MSLEDPVIICCSISGAVANRDQCPAIPYTPEDYAAEARRIVDEGGVHIHIHARRPDGTPSYEVEDFEAITEAIKAEVGDAAIINFSTGTIGVPLSKRIEYLRACPPEVAALNMGSMNYAKYSQEPQGLRLQAASSPTRSTRSSSCWACSTSSASSPSTSASTSATSARWRRWSTWVCWTSRCTSTS